MKRIIAALAVLGVLAFNASLPAFAAEKPVVGRIIIVGNTETPDWFVHEFLCFRTGDRLVYPLMRIAERDLGRCGRFVVDTQQNIRPTVRTLKENDDGKVVDIVVTVHERPRNCFVPASYELVAIRSVGYCQRLRYEAGVLVEFINNTFATWRDQYR